MDLRLRINYDEWSVWEPNACPMFYMFRFNCTYNAVQKYFAMPLYNTIMVFEHDKVGNQTMKWILNDDDYRIFGQQIIGLLMCPQYKAAFDDGITKSQEILDARIMEILKTDYKFSEVPDVFDGLAEIHSEYMKYSTQYDGIQAQLDYVLTKFISKHYNQNDAANIIAALFTPEESIYTTEIFKSLYKCSLAYETKSNKLNELLVEHSNNFFWKYNNYFSTIYVTPEDVLKEIKQKNSAYYKNLIDSGEIEKTKLLKTKAKTITKLPNYERRLVEIADNYGSKFADDRKIMIWKTMAAVEKLLNIISAETKTHVDDLKLLIPQELRHFLSNPKSYKQRFEERRKLFVVVNTRFPLVDETIDDTSKICITKDPFIAEGDVAIKTLEQLNTRLGFFKDSGFNSVRIQGAVAHRNEDQITGIVRIIKNPKTETVKAGEILVAPYTQPDYLPSMEKSLAIVTDYGGQTSHGAVISREMRKPCIVGTKYASSVLKTGQKIKINFIDGTIEVIE